MKMTMVKSGLKGLIIRELNTIHHASFASIVLLTWNSRFGICYKYIKGYYDVSWYNDIAVLSNSYLRSGNAGLVLRMKVVKTELFKICCFLNGIIPLWNALPRQLKEADLFIGLNVNVWCITITLLQILIQIMYVHGQGYVGVTAVCVIVVLHVKTFLLFSTFLTSFYFFLKELTYF